MRHFCIFYFSLCFTLTNAFYILDRIRSKRTPDAADASSPRAQPYFLPAGYKPYPDANMSESLEPSFPMAHSYANGLDVNPGKIKTLDGNLNLPIPGWGMWDMSGHQLWGPQETWMNYGHLIQPVNNFNLTPSQLNDVMSSPGYQEAKAKASPQAPVQLPGGFVPANCTPPMCNPFISQVANGVQFLPGNKNKQYDGNLDFPIPTGPDGRNVRFPISGNYVAGKSPFMYTHGQVLNPINPFPGYKPTPGGGSDQAAGTSLLERTNTGGSAASAATANNEPADLPPLPPNYHAGGNRAKRADRIRLAELLVGRSRKAIM